MGVEPADKPKTAFITQKGLFQFRVLPYGLCNAAATFGRLMEAVLAGLQLEICLIYLDDIITFGRTFEEAVENLEKVFNRLLDAGLKLKIAKKCDLFAKTVSFLRHTISDEGIATDPNKVKVVREWPTPMDQTEVRSFLGLYGYYRRFIKGYSTTAKPLHRLTEKGREYIWNEECQREFDRLKEHLTNAPVLEFPEFSQEFILDTDASDNTIGAVLSQKHNGKEKVVSYGIRTLSKAERGYSVTRKEMLAVVYFVKHDRHYLLGRKFVIRTDHSALRSLMKTKEPEGQTARWIEHLSSCDFEIRHRPGKKHTNADTLSRIPWRRKEPGKGARAVTNSTSEDKELMTIQEAQLKDPELKMVRDWVEKEERPVWTSVSGKSYRVKAYWSSFRRLCIHNGCLCRIWYEGHKPNRYQILLPRDLRVTVLQHCHDSSVGGHFGLKKRP